MKINNIVKIGEKEVNNNNLLYISFKEDYTPILSFRGNNSVGKVQLPIKTKTIIEIITKHAFNEGCSLGSFTLIQNEAEEIIDIVKYNSSEYKKYFSKTTIKPSSLKQGTLVKLEDGEQLVFIKQFYYFNDYRLISLFSNLKPVQQTTNRNKDDLIRTVSIFNFFENEPELSNVFYSLNQNKIVVYKTTSKSKKIVEKIGMVPQFEKNNPINILRDDDESFFEDFVNVNELEFNRTSSDPSLKYNRIKKSKVFISSKIVLTNFKQLVLNHINQL